MSLSVMLAFTDTGVGVYAQNSSIPFDVSHPQLTSVLDFQLPESIGTIKERFDGSSGKTVILIQDAHAVPEAQRQIRNALDFLEQHYGLRTAALEGAVQALDAQIFRSFPDRQLLKNVFQDYLDRAELTGTTMAAIFNAQPARYEGIEDEQLYNEAYGAFLTSLERMPARREKYREIEEQLQVRKSELYSAELYDLDLKLTAFYRNEISLAELLDALAGIQAPDPQSSIALMLGEMKSSEENLVPVEMEVRKLAEAVEQNLKSRAPDMENGREAVATFNEKMQSFQLSQVSPEEFALILKELTVRLGMKVRVSEKLQRMIEQHKCLRDLEGTRFFEELQLYIANVKESLMRSDSDRELDRIAQCLQLLERLMSLELTADEWNELKSIQPAMLEPQMQSFFENLSAQKSFYASTEARDLYFASRIQEFLKTDSLVALVTGGFHTSGLRRIFEQNGISYIIVSPAIRKLPDENLYHDQMRGSVSWSGYYNAGDEKVNAYRAFVRRTRDELLALSSVDRGLLLKEWRDSIIRDLASENRVQEAGRYTFFLDEMSGGTDGFDSERLHRFAESLRLLEQRGSAGTQNILNLLNGATLSIPHTYRVLEDFDFIARPDLAARAEQRIAWMEPDDSGEFNAVVRTVQDYVWTVKEWRGYVETLDSVLVTDMERGLTLQLQGDDKINGNPLDWLRQGAIHVFGQAGRDLDAMMPIRLSLIKRQEGDHDEYALTVQLQYRSEQRKLEPVSLDPLPEEDSLAAKNQALFEAITTAGPGLLEAIDGLEIEELTVNEDSWYLSALFKKDGKGIPTKRFLEVLTPENIEETEAEAGFRLYAERQADGVHALVFEGDTIPGQTSELIRALFTYTAERGVDFVHLHHLSDYSRSLFTRELEKYGPRPEIEGETFQVDLAQYEFMAETVRSEMRLVGPGSERVKKLQLLDPAPGASNEQKAAGFYNEIIAHSKALSERIGSVSVESFVLRGETLTIGLHFLDHDGNEIITRVTRDGLDYQAPMEINIIAQQEPGGSLYIANFDSTGLKGFSDQVLRVTLDWFRRIGVSRVSFDLLTPHSRAFLNWFLSQFGPHTPIGNNEIFIDIYPGDFNFSESPDTPESMRSEQRDRSAGSRVQEEQLLLAGNGYETTPVLLSEKGYFTIEDEFDEPMSFITFKDAFRVMRTADGFFGRLTGFGERGRSLTVNLRNAAHELATNIIDHGGVQGLVAVRHVSGETPVFELLGRDFGAGISDPQALLNKAYEANRGKGLQLFARLIRWYPGSTVSLESNGRKWTLNEEGFIPAGESTVNEGTQITIQVPESAGRRSEQREPQLPSDFFAYGQPFTIGKIKSGIAGIRPDVRIIEDAEIGIGTMFAIPNLTFRVVPMDMAAYEARLQSERIKDADGLAMKEVLPYVLEVYEFDLDSFQYRFRPIPEILFSRGEAFTIGRLQYFDSSGLTRRADLEEDLGIRPLDTEEFPQAYKAKDDRVAIYQGDPSTTGVFLPRRNNDNRISRYRTEPDNDTRYEDHRDISPDYIDESAYERPGHVDIEIVESDAGDVLRLTSRGSTNGVLIQKTNTIIGDIPEYGHQVGVSADDLDEQSESMNSLVLPRGAEVEVVREAPSIHHPKYPFEIRVEGMDGKTRIRIVLQYIEDGEGNPQFRIYDETSESISDQIFDINQTELQGWLLPFEIKLSKLLGRPRAVIRLREDAVLNQIRDGHNGKEAYYPRVFVRTLSDGDVADEMSDQIIQRARNQNLLPDNNIFTMFPSESISDQTVSIGGIDGKFVLENGRVDFKQKGLLGRVRPFKAPHSTTPANVSAGEPLNIGRHPANQIVLNDEKVSRYHAALTYTDGRYFLEDLDSRNGTFVNGSKITEPVEIIFRSEQRAYDLPEALKTVLDKIEADYKQALRDLKQDAGQYLNPDLAAGSGFEARYSQIITDVITEVFEAFNEIEDLSSRISVYVLGSLARRAAPYGTDIDIFVVADENDPPASVLIERIVSEIDRILDVGVDTPAEPSIGETDGVFVPTAVELRQRLDELVGVSLRSLLDRRRVFGSDTVHVQLERVLDSDDFNRALSRWHDLNVGRMSLEDASLVSRDDLEELLDRYLNRRINNDLKIERIQASLNRDYYFEFHELILEGLLNNAYTLDDIYESSNYLGNQFFEQTDSFANLENIDKFDPKGDPGGLRTIQIVGYLGRYLYADDTVIAGWTYTEDTMYDLPRFLADMTGGDFLTDEDVQIMEEATAFFLRFRSALNLAVEQSGNRNLKKDEYTEALRQPIAHLMKINPADLDALIIKHRKAMVRLFSELLDLHFDYAQRSEQRRFTMDPAPGSSHAEREAALFRELQEISPELTQNVFDAVVIDNPESAGRPERFLRVAFRKNGAPIPTRIYTGQQSFTSAAGFNLEAEVIQDPSGRERVRMVGFYGGNIPGHTSEMLRMLLAFVQRRGADTVVLNHLNPHVQKLFERELSKYGPAPLIPDTANQFEFALADYDFSSPQGDRSEQRRIAGGQAQAISTVFQTVGGMATSAADRENAALVMIETGAGAFADLLESVYATAVSSALYAGERARLLAAFKTRFGDTDLSLGLLFPDQDSVWRRDDLSSRLADQISQIGAGEVVLSGENIVTQPFRDKNLRVRHTSANRKIFVPGQEILLPMAILGDFSALNNLHQMYLPVWAEGLDSIRDPELRDHIQFLQLLSAATVGALVKQNPALAEDRTLLGAELIKTLGPAYERIVVMQNGGLGINSAAAQVFMKLLAADRISASA